MKTGSTTARIKLVENDSPFTIRRWLCDNGSHEVELIDASEQTWEKYCAWIACHNSARDIEITFNQSGNTVIGNYSAYLPLDRAIAKKTANILFPHGLTISGDKTDIAKLADYVLTFGNCIKTLQGWKKACELAGCKFHAAILA